MSPVADMDLRRYLAYVARDVEKKGTSLRYFFGCLAGAMEYLHQNGVIHRDIKPNNILVKEDRVFFSDFGTALVRTASKRSTSSERLVPRNAIYMA
jgi:serine/threonine protein kinase